jgi:hypothetical protein
MRTTGSVVFDLFCTVLADVCNHLGHTADGLQALAEAHILVEQHEERNWEAESPLRRTNRSGMNRGCWWKSRTPLPAAFTSPAKISS